MPNIKDMKKASGAASFQKLRDAIQKTKTTYEKDTRYWTPTVDSAGNGSATIRFLPAPAEEEVPFVRYYDHNFKGPTGRYYIAMSLTTLGQDDPVSVLNNKLWNAADYDEAPGRKLARKQKRNLHYVSNIQVIRDPANADNEGKVFLYRYGKKIMDKIENAANPRDADDKSVNPFDMWKGANFRIRIKKVKDWRNYDDSSFESPSPIGTDEEIEKVWQATYPLLPEISEDKFLSYDKLEAKLYDVIGTSADAILGSGKTSQLRTSNDVDGEKSNRNSLASETTDNRADENDDKGKEGSLSYLMGESESKDDDSGNSDNLSEDDKILEMFKNM